MDPSTLEVRAPSEGDHLTKKPTLSCSPAIWNAFTPGTTGHSFSICVAQVLLQVPPPSVNSPHLEFPHLCSAPHPTPDAHQLFYYWTAVINFIQRKTAENSSELGYLQQLTMLITYGNTNAQRR